MKVAQIKDLVNNSCNEIVGKDKLVNDDLSNLVDVGKEVFQADAVDNYVGKLVDQVGKLVFKDRQYTGSAPSVMMDSWQFGAVVEKIQADTPEAVENDSWNLQDGQDYSPNIFYKPKVSAKFFSNKVTFEIDMSFTDLQVRESFQNANQMNAFLTMLFNSVDKSMTMKMDSLIMDTINNFTANTLLNAYPTTGANTNPDYTKVGNTRAVNLLANYKKDTGKTLTVQGAMKDTDFLKYASMVMGLYEDRLKRISTLFNIGGCERFTPTANLHVVMLSDFKVAADTYLQSDTFHNEFTALPSAETVPFWQGTGNNYDFDSVSGIDLKTNDGKSCSANGILAVMFDSDALGVCNTNRRVNTNRNPKAEFYTNFYKFDASYFNDFNENFIVFFIA